MGNDVEMEITSYSPERKSHVLAQYPLCVCSMDPEAGRSKAHSIASPETDLHLGFDHSILCIVNVPSDWIRRRRLLVGPFWLADDHEGLETGEPGTATVSSGLNYWMMHVDDYE